jgi:nitrogen-specific signal transduction histidine kinase
MSNIKGAVSERVKKNIPDLFTYTDNFTQVAFNIITNRCKYQDPLI